VSRLFLGRNIFLIQATRYFGGVILEINIFPWLYLPENKKPENEHKRYLVENTSIVLSVSRMLTEAEKEAICAIYREYSPNAGFPFMPLDDLRNELENQGYHEIASCLLDPPSVV
jgi:hypothetical protein